MRWLTSAEPAHRLRTLRRDGTTWLGRGGAGRFSLAGAQAKTALFGDGRRWGVPIGAHPTSHILKPAIHGFDHHEINEHLCLETARRLGIRAARSHLLSVEDQTAVVVERYDRLTGPDGRLRRVHQEDLCQALGVPPSQNYEADGGPGPAAVIAVLRAVMGDAAGTDAVERFTAALAFNWLIGGTDAHAKNYSLLLSADQVRLAPIYDLASALVYPGVHERRLQMAMKVGRGYGLWPRSDPWPLAAGAWGVDAGGLRERVLAMSEALPDALRDAAAAPAVAALDSPLPARLLDRVAARAARCRAVMGAPRRG